LECHRDYATAAIELRIGYGGGFGDQYPCAILEYSTEHAFTTTVAGTDLRPGTAYGGM